eukprot:scaffold25329_cov114-Isochrysis_galbana.AAC.2
MHTFFALPVDQTVPLDEVAGFALLSTAVLAAVVAPVCQVGLVPQSARVRNRHCDTRARPWVGSTNLQPRRRATPPTKPPP